MVITSIKDAFSVAGKNALITGGTQGLGRAMMEAYAELGANVGFTGRTLEKGQKVEQELAERFPAVKITFYQADHRTQEGCQSAVDAFIADYGKIDVLINNAGAGAGADSIDFIDNNFADWHSTIDLDLTGVFMMSTMAAKSMRETGGGSIINISSMAGMTVLKPQVCIAYSTAKAAVIHMTKSLAWEWAKYGIRVNTIAPGYFKTELEIAGLADEWLEMSPTDRFGEPIEVAAAAVYLGSDASDQITGTPILIDGGYCLAN